MRVLRRVVSPRPPSTGEGPRQAHGGFCLYQTHALLTNYLRENACVVGYLRSSTVLEGFYQQLGGLSQALNKIP